VLQPAIVGMGTHEGESYDQSRIWAKALVLVDEDGPAQAQIEQPQSNQ
jgi:hypothetical protein